MLIKSKHKDQLKGLGKKRAFTKTRWYRMSKRLLVFLFLVVLFGGGVWLGMKLNEGRGYAPNTLTNKMLDRFNSPEFGEGWDAIAAAAPNVNINIKHLDLQTLYMHRDQALNGNAAFDYVPASIEHEGTEIPVKIRLKGDRQIHWDDIRKMSFRVKATGDNTLFGMKKFSLQKPRAKNYIHEWLFHECLKREGLIGLRYKFITLSLNGDPLGTYAVEEHFEKRLIENNQHREGPIIRMTEGPGYSFYTAPILPYDEKKWVPDNKVQLLNTAINQMEAWRRGDMKTSAAFDVEKLAKYFALCDLLGAEHGAIWKSVKWYFNPVTGKLEPVGIDAQLRFTYKVLSSEIGLRPDIGYVNETYEDYYNHLFVNDATFDSVFYVAYIKELERMSQTEYLNTLFTEIRDDLELNQALIYKDFPLFADHIHHYGPDFHRFSEAHFYSKQGYIRDKLDALNGLEAYYHHADDRYVYFDVGNTTTFPLHLKNVRFNLESDLVELDSSYKIPPRHLKSNISFTRVRVPLPADSVWTDSMAYGMRIRYAVYGKEKYRGHPVNRWERNVDVAADGHLMTLDSLNMSQLFLEVNEEKKSIVFKQGDWELNQPLVLPAGYHVFIADSTKLDLKNGAMIISRSPWEVAGSEQNPATFYSSDSTGQGILVLNCGERSVLNHAVFNNLSDLSHKGWGVSGAVNFYESEATFTNCKFLNNRSEDGLNMIRSKFEANYCLWSGTQSDAFDGDFIDGTIANSRFVNLGNDAVDVSGSHLILKAVEVDSAADKGVSAGENSRIYADNITVVNTAIAIASKDKSTIKIEGLKLENCQVGFTVFQKKPEFGPAGIAAFRVMMEGIERPYLNEENSVLMVNGETIEPTKDKVEDILYGVEYGVKTVR